MPRPEHDFPTAQLLEAISETRAFAYDAGKDDAGLILSFVRAAVAAGDETALKNHLAAYVAPKIGAVVTRRPVVFTGSITPGSN